MIQNYDLIWNNLSVFAFFMKIRELKISDYSQVIELWTKSFSNKFDNKINTHHLSDPSSFTLVSVDNNTITAVASLYIIKKKIK